MFTYEVLQSFNELDQKIYEYILKNLDKVPYMRVRELADAAHVSTSTIIRFCKKTGCEGYAEFKLRLKEFVKTKRGQFQLKDSSLDIIHFFETFYTEEYNQIAKRVVHLVSEASQVIFVGVGNSSGIAQYGARYFSNLGKLSFTILDPFFPIRANTTKEHSKNTVVIFLSISGETKEILQLIEQVQILKYKTISITSTKSSSLGQLTDECLPFYLNHISDKEIDVSSQIATVAWIERIGRAIYD